MADGEGEAEDLGGREIEMRTPLTEILKNIW